MQAVNVLTRVSRREEEANDSAEFVGKLEWELTKIGRDLFNCALVCLTLLFEGEKHGVLGL